MISKLGMNNMNFGQLTVMGTDRKGKQIKKECGPKETVQAFSRNYDTVNKDDALVRFPDRKGEFLVLSNPQITADGKNVDLSNLPRTGAAISPDGKMSPLQ